MLAPSKSQVYSVSFNVKDNRLCVMLIYTNTHTTYKRKTHEREANLLCSKIHPINPSGSNQSSVSYFVYAGACVNV